MHISIYKDYSTCSKSRPLPVGTTNSYLQEHWKKYNYSSGNKTFEQRQPSTLATPDCAAMLEIVYCICKHVIRWQQSRCSCHLQLTTWLQMLWCKIFMCVCRVAFLICTHTYAETEYDEHVYVIFNASAYRDHALNVCSVVQPFWVGGPQGEGSGPPPQIFFLPILSLKWRVFVHSWCKNYYIWTAVRRQHIVLLFLNKNILRYL